MNPEMSWIGMGISIDKESQFAKTNMPVSGPSAVEVGIAAHEALVAAQSKAKPFPVVGQTCYIKRKVKRTPSGETLGLNRAEGKPVAARITAVYLDGTVRTGISDVWEVTPGTNNSWETVNPFHGKSE